MSYAEEAGAWLLARRLLRERADDMGAPTGKLPAWPKDASARVLLSVLTAGLVVGTATHVENIARTGLSPRPELPLACNLFWSTLVIVDPIAALVLLRWPRTGVVVVAALMAVDLTVNLAIARLGLTTPIVVQMAYAMLALVAVPVVRSAR